MDNQLFYSSSLWVVLVGMSIVLVLAAELGYLIGDRASRHGVEQTQIGTIQSSILGMLALMLGFTFGAAWTRYDNRRILAINEANAIGTTFLRAQSLPEPYRTNLSTMLHRYVDLRVLTAQSVDDPQEFRKLRSDTEKLQQSIWKQAANVCYKYPSDITGLFAESLNQSIDLYASRSAEFLARVPETILWILTFIAIVSLGVVGYGFGISRQKGWLIVLLISIIVAAVIVMIVDLDRPGVGPTRVSNQTMINLKNSLDGFEVRREVGRR